MNFKAYLLASLIIPTIALLFIIIGLSFEAYSGHFVLANEIEDGGLFFLFFGFLLFVLICLITTFLIIFFVPLILRSYFIYSKRNFYLSGILIGMAIAIITLSLMADGNLSRDSGLYTMWFAIVGGLYGLFSAHIYGKYAYAFLDIYD